MTIRTFLPGDEAAQVRIYNEGAGELPKFKPATLDEVRRRCRAPEFDPTTRLFALEGEEPVAYAAFQANGRVGYPWCGKGFEHWRQPLFEAVLDSLRARGVRQVFTAYRTDWQVPLDFFQTRGFRHARDMVNFVVDLAETPTSGVRGKGTFSLLRREDVPAVVALAPEVFRHRTLAELENAWLANPYFSASAFFVLRQRETGQPEAVGLVIADAAYANPKQVDANMPCFRLGAFGTEGMSTKRIQGLVSVLARAADVQRLGIELMRHAAQRLQSSEAEALAAQAPSDVPHLLRFYESHFRRQGSFPVLESSLDPGGQTP